MRKNGICDCDGYGFKDTPYIHTYGPEERKIEIRIRLANRICSGGDPCELRECEAGDRRAERLLLLQAPRHRHHHRRGTLQVLNERNNEQE